MRRDSLRSDDVRRRNLRSDLSRGGQLQYLFNSFANGAPWSRGAKEVVDFFLRI